MFFCCNTLVSYVLINVESRIYGTLIVIRGFLFSCAFMILHAIF